jgi:hypothetical protein
MTSVDAYPRLPRWETTGQGSKLVTHDGQILGWVERQGNGVIRKRLFRAFDERGQLMSGGVPMSMLFAKSMVEVHHDLWEGMVQE